MRSERDQEMLQKAVTRKLTPIYMKSRNEVLDYYQDTYGANWKSHAAAALAGTTDKKSRAYKSASRQFQMNTKTGKERYKGEKVLGATKARYEAIGKTLPPIGKKLEGNTLTITVKGNQDRGVKHGGMIYDKTITVTFKGSDAYAFANNPTYYEIWEGYGVDGNDFEDGSGKMVIISVS